MTNRESPRATASSETRSTAGEAVPKATLRRLETAAPGGVVAPDHPDFDEARRVYFHGMDRRPLAILRPRDTDEVVRAVTELREANLPFTVRGGGHSPAGYAVMDGVLTLDLSQLTRLDLDPAGRTAWASAGLTTGDFTRAGAEHGLATGFGDTGSVAVGGITLAGGIGFLHRKLGLTIDSLLAAEVVTADGKVLHVDADTEPDLFWALRGGGGNFGVVTRLQLRLHDVDRVVGGMLLLPCDPDILTRFLERCQEAPEELSGLVNVLVAPPMPFVPAEHHGRLIIAAILVYSGDEARAEQAFAPLRQVAPPIADMIEPTPYVGLFHREAGPPPPALVHAHTGFLDALDRAGAEATLHHLQHTASATMNVAQFRIMGGAVARVPADATAFAHRDRGMMVNMSAVFEEPGDEDRHVAWAAEAAAALGPEGSSGAYVGFLGREGEARVREAYPGRHWSRLAEIKRRFDPENVFRHNQNVPPEG